MHLFSYVRVFTIPHSISGCHAVSFLPPRLALLPSAARMASPPRFNLLPCRSVPALPPRLQDLPVAPPRVFLLGCDFYGTGWHCMSLLPPMLSLLPRPPAWPQRANSRACRHPRGTSRPVLVIPGTVRGRAVSLRRVGAVGAVGGPCAYRVPPRTGVRKIRAVFLIPSGPLLQCSRPFVVPAAFSLVRSGFRATLAGPASGPAAGNRGNTRREVGRAVLTRQFRLSSSPGLHLCQYSSACCC